MTALPALNDFLSVPKRHPKRPRFVGGRCFVAEFHLSNGDPDYGDAAPQSDIGRIVRDGSLIE